MKLPRDVSGERLIRMLVRNCRYRKVHQVGSHVVLQTDDPKHHRLSVPNHPVLKVGTLNAILRQVAKAKNIPREHLASKL